MSGEPLVNGEVRGAARRRLQGLARRMRKVILDETAAMDLFHLGTGAFSPLDGFLGKADVASVLERNRLSNGTPWTVPITLAVGSAAVRGLRDGEEVALHERPHGLLGTLVVNEVFRYPRRSWAQQLFGTTSATHPGVARLARRGATLLGGRIQLLNRPRAMRARFIMTPRQTRAIFVRRGWQTVAAFHTRNLPHRAHEYLQRCALEVVDGLFIHPIVGPKKRGDFETEAVLAGYRYFIDQFFPAGRVCLAAFARPVEYAGPREAVFHAIVRRNFGCTHIIIGRDHAGVDGRYGLYAAHAIFDEVGELGIQPLRMRGPFHCRRCGVIATDKTCGHPASHRMAISGTDVRRYIAAGKVPPPEIIRPELGEFLLRYQRRRPLFHS